jgi:hypothetical protein
LARSVLGCNVLRCVVSHDNHRDVLIVLQPEIIGSISKSKVHKSQVNMEIHPRETRMPLLMLITWLCVHVRDEQARL